MLVLKNIFKSFADIKALNDVSLEIKKGSVTTLLGANGAGKTTLMRVITGIVEPDAGFVEVFGYNIKQNRVEALQYIGYMPENNPLYLDFSVKELLFFMAKLKKVDVKNISKIIEKLSLKDVLEQKIATLSKGYKSRVAIAVAILARPKILILDEPTEGLDPNQKKILRELLKEYAKDNVVLISTHIIEEASELNSRVLVLNKGRIVVDDSVFEIENNNKNLAEHLRKMME